MIALDTGRLAGVSALYGKTLHPPVCEVHRQAQADRAAPDDQHLDLERLAHNRFTAAIGGHDRDFASPPRSRVHREPGAGE